MGKGGGGVPQQMPEPAPEPVTVEKEKSSVLMGSKRKRGYSSTFKSGTENNKTLLGL